MPRYRTATLTAAAALLALAAAPAAARPDDPYPKRDDDAGARLEQRTNPKPIVRWKIDVGSGDDPRFNPAVVDYPADYPAEAKSLKLQFGSGPARVGVLVPANADVWVGDQLTGQGGRFREFLTPPLVQGGDYHYDIRAHWREDGRAVDQTRRVTVHANGWASVDFTRP
jgi:uncharacterized protein (TIGR03000 family)